MPVKKQFYVLENDELTGERVENLHVHGPFGSRDEARRWIVEDAARCWKDADTHQETVAEWGSRCAIVEVVDRLLPVPIPCVKWQLRRCK